MRKLKVSKIWIPAFLLAVLVAGCGDPDKGANTGNPNNPLTPPTAISVTPTAGATLVCRNTPVINATFSKAMNPATINTSTFILSDPSGASVPGAVSIDSADLVATFTPTSPLLVSTTYLVTITTGAADTFGNRLAASFVWSFTTSSSPTCLPPVGAVSLGTACGYGVLGGSTVTSMGPTVVKALSGTADLGLSPGTSVVGFQDPPFNTYQVGTGGGHTFGPGLVTGTIHITDTPPMPNDAATAQLDLTTAYNDLAGRTAPAPTTITPLDIGGRTLAPGIWKSASTVAITGTVTLDGQGDANAVWIFQVGSALTTLSGSNVNLINGASAHNVFWAVFSGATLGTTSTFNGSILSNTGGITLNTGTTMTGRALQRTPDAVTLNSAVVTIPACP